jgi:hypothetical protein
MARKKRSVADTGDSSGRGREAIMLLCSSAICDGACQAARRSAEADHFKGV